MSRRKVNVFQPITLRGACDLFIGQYRPTTARTYGMTLKPLADYLGPDRPLEKVTRQLVVEFMQMLDERPTLKSPASYNKHVKALRTFFYWCIRMKYIKENPADALHHRRLSKAVPKEKAMTDEEYEKLLDFAKWHPRNYALVLFLGDTGCRAGGAMGLKVQDINFEDNTAVLTEKGDKQRRVWFGAECAAAIKAWLNKRKNPVGPYVFSLHGDQILSHEAGQIIRRMCKRAGIRSMGSHSLRHRKGHQLADSRIAPTVAATALGHESVMTTLQHYYPKDDKRAEKIMRRLVHGYQPGQDDMGIAAEIEEQEPPTKIISGVNWRAG